MSKVFTKRNRKVIASAALTIFSLFVAMTGTFTWFVSKMNESGVANEFSVHHDDSMVTTLSCYAIKYDGVYGAKAIKINDGSQSVKMSEYDYILRDKNINTPLFLRIELSGFDSNKDLQVNIPCYGSYLVENQTYIDNKLSNVIWAKFSYGLKIGGVLIADDYVLTGDEITGPDVKTIYEGMRDNASGQTGTAFVKSPSHKDNNVQLSIDHTDLYNSANIVHRDINDDGVDDDIIVVYVVIDYYDSGSTNLVEDYVNSYDGTGIDYSLSFDADIGAMTLKDIEA